MNLGQAITHSIDLEMNYISSICLEVELKLINFSDKVISQGVKVFMNFQGTIIQVEIAKIIECYDIIQNSKQTIEKPKIIKKNKVIKAVLNLSSPLFEKTKNSDNSFLSLFWMVN